MATVNKATERQLEVIRKLYIQQHVVDRGAQFYLDVDRFSEQWEAVEYKKGGHDVRGVAIHLTVDDLTYIEAETLINVLKDRCLMEAEDWNERISSDLGFYAG